MEGRDQFVENLKKTIDQWNEQIAKVEAKMAEATEESKRAYHQQIEEMTKHADEARKQMEKLAETSAADWGKRRTAFEEAWHDIAGGFGRAWSRFF